MVFVSIYLVLIVTCCKLILCYRGVNGISPGLIADTEGANRLAEHFRESADPLQVRHIKIYTSKL